MVSTGRVLLVCKEVEKSVPFGVQLRHLLALVHVNVEENPFVRGNNGKEVGQSNFRTNSAPSSSVAGTFL